MAWRFDDTIAAIASPPGPAARGIIRVSGSDTAVLLAQLLIAPDDAFGRRIASRFAATLTLSDVPLDLSVYYWPTKRSYTGEPMAELHMPGSPPLLEAALASLYAGNIRPARRGEFTLRAFLAGRIDLLQAEAVLGVIDAADHEELELALGQLAGGISGSLRDLRSGLIAALGDLEAGLDFVEEDIEFIGRDQLVARLQSTADQVQDLIDSASDRMQSTGRQQVVLAGLPNAGKSTLFNALIGSEAAIVSKVEGTTRDYLSAPLDCDGLSVDLIDTAGAEDDATGIDGIAQQQRSEQITDADLVIWCTAADLTSQQTVHDRKRLDECLSVARNVLCITTKMDCAKATEQSIAVSGTSGVGLERLEQEIRAQLSDTHRNQRLLLGSTAARCRESLQAVLDALHCARDNASGGMGDEIIALDIRAALDGIGRVTGEVFTDDILDHIFSSFCIGK